MKATGSAQTFAARHLETAPITELFSPRLTQGESRVCLIALLLALIARFQALLPGYSIDDYMFVNQSLPPWFDPASAANGRALSYALYAALARIGAAPPRSSVFFIVLLTIVLLGAGVAACRLWRLSDNAGASLIVICFVVLHPYQAEMFTFRTASMIAATALALAFGALLLCLRSRTDWLVSTLCLACAIAIYQVVLNYLAIVVLFSLAFHWARPGGFSRDSFRELRAHLSLIAASLVLYAIFTFAVIRLSGVALGSRAALIGPSEIGGRIAVLWECLYRMLVQAEPVFPPATKAILLLTFGLGLLAVLIRRAPHWRRHASVLALIAIAGLPLCFGVLLVLHEWYAPIRVLSQSSLYWGGIMAMLHSFLDPRGRRLLGAGCALVFLSFIGINGGIFSDQLRVNLRDMAETNRIVQRIEALPNFRDITGAAIIGGWWAYASPIRTVQDDMNISALYAEWAKIGILNEASGYRFREAPPTVKAQAIEYCKQSPKWPAPESVSRIGPVAVVCLPGD